MENITIVPFIVPVIEKNNAYGRNYNGEKENTHCHDL